MIFIEKEKEEDEKRTGIKAKPKGKMQYKRY